MRGKTEGFFCWIDYMNDTHSIETYSILIQMDFQTETGSDYEEAN
jgi:hypothetical protein